MHQTLLHEPGSYELIVAKGEYAFFLFGDPNGNGIFDAGEPVGTVPIVSTGTGVVSSPNVFRNCLILVTGIIIPFTCSLRRVDEIDKGTLAG